MAQGESYHYRIGKEKVLSDEELKLREQDKLMKDKGRVIAYSVYVGSVIGLKTLEDKAMVDITDNSRVISFNFRRPLYDAIGDSLRGLYLMLLQNKEQIKNTDEDKMMTILSSFYKTMINSAEIYKDQFLALARKEDLTTKFKIDEITFDGYSYSSFKIMRPAELMDSVFSEIRRVLKPGGVAYISEPVYAGDFNEVLKLFHDEKAVREAAFAAEQRAVSAGGLVLVTQKFFLQPMQFMGRHQVAGIGIGIGKGEHLAP